MFSVEKRVSRIQNSTCNSKIHHWKKKLWPGWFQWFLKQTTIAFLLNTAHLLLCEQQPVSPPLQYDLLLSSWHRGCLKKWKKCLLLQWRGPIGNWCLVDIFYGVSLGFSSWFQIQSTSSISKRTSWFSRHPIEEYVHQIGPSLEN